MGGSRLLLLCKLHTKQRNTAPLRTKVITFTAENAFFLFVFILLVINICCVCFFLDTTTLFFRLINYSFLCLGKGTSVIPHPSQ